MEGECFYKRFSFCKPGGDRKKLIMLHPTFCHSVRLALASPSKLNYLNPFLLCALKPQIARDYEVPDTAAHFLILVKGVFV